MAKKPTTWMTSSPASIHGSLLAKKVTCQQVNVRDHEFPGVEITYERNAEEGDSNAEQSTMISFIDIIRCIQGNEALNNGACVQS